jgi:hypothetical protein
MEKTARVSACFVAVIRCSGGQTKRVEASKASGMRERERDSRNRQGSDDITWKKTTGKTKDYTGG